MNRVVGTKEVTMLRQLAREVLGKALQAGATDAEAVVYEGEEFSALVRLGQVETLKESGSRAVGLRVFVGQKGGEYVVVGLFRRLDRAIGVGRGGVGEGDE